MAATHGLAVLLVAVSFSHTVHGKFPHCLFMWEMQEAERECVSRLEQQQQQPASSSGCPGEWDSALCWSNTAVGVTATQFCPAPFKQLFGKNGSLSRNCTQDGWSQVYPAIHVACWSDATDERELVFYRVVGVLSTLGHSLSLITLLTSTVIICLFRRLHCMRNYIHLNLFVSFMLRAVAVLTKDTLLFSADETTDCSTQPSLVGCKTALVFFHYFIMANFFWLLVEGLYLHMLLLVNCNYITRLSVYMLIGWGIPVVFMVSWILCRVHFEDTGCWEKNETPIPDRLINWPIMASIIMNFILFICIIRILVQKLRCSNVGGNELPQYRRLAKSTLLLIPLFGINYVAFFYLESTSKNTSRELIKIFFELGLGSFQGLIVAILYCFLNSEVQSELKRTWRSLSLKRYVGGDCRLHAMSVSRHENSAHLPRNSRAQSILQTEITVL